MLKLTVCVLTCNSERLLREVLSALSQVADEWIVVDSGSEDLTLEICRSFDIKPIFRSYTTHAEQMNYAISMSSYDWVLCMDSDEILDKATIQFIDQLKNARDVPATEKAFRIKRYWYVLGKPVSRLYPVSSPDKPARLFNRQKVCFNDAPVDDSAEGYAETELIPGHVRHDTFYSIHELFNKANSYTTRLVKYRDINPSLLKSFTSGIAAFIKWYMLSGAWRDGKIGFVTGVYAGYYTFLKYFKAWCQKNFPSR